MLGTRNKLIQLAAFTVALSLAATSTLAFAQDGSNSAPPDGAQQQQPGPPPDQGWHRFSHHPQNEQPVQTVPSHLTLSAGAFVTVRVNQYLSSNKNKPGDQFTATLAKPLVLDGLVVAQRGQTVAGRVVDAKKAGRIKGVSRLALVLTDLTLVDGQQVPIQTQLTGWKGPKSVGRDAAAVGTTTGIGAVVGAAADGGSGAAIGAGAGAAAATIGVLLTRGRPTVVYPEALLTFRIAAPVTISTAKAPQAFRDVQPGDYAQPAESQGPPPRLCPPPGCAPPPYFWGAGPYFWPGPFWYGPRFYGYGRGFRR
jgi:hypothetical protein